MAPDANFMCIHHGFNGGESIMKATSIYALRTVQEAAAQSQTQIGGKWVPARPVGYFSLRYRIKAAIMVLNGKADALVWPEGQ